MKRGKNAKGTPFSSQTKYDFVSVIKTFYRWLIDESLSNIPEKKILAIKSPTRENTKTADDLLSPEEIRALLNACTTIKDRTLLSVLYEGGFMTEPDKCPNLLSRTEGKWTEYRCKSSGVSCSREFCDAKDHI